MLAVSWERSTGSILRLRNYITNWAPDQSYSVFTINICKLYSLALVLLNPDFFFFKKKHCRSRSAGFWQSHLIRIHTVCHLPSLFLYEKRLWFWIFSISHWVGGNQKLNQQSTNADQKSIQCFGLPFVASGTTNGNQKHCFHKFWSTFLDSIGIFECPLQGVYINCYSVWCDLFGL